jgi:hypothetical protein
MGQGDQVFRHQGGMIRDVSAKGTIIASGILAYLAEDASDFPSYAMWFRRRPTIAHRRDDLGKSGGVCRRRFSAETHERRGSKCR